MNCQSNFIVSSFIFNMIIFQVKWTAARRPTQRFGTVPRKSLCSACYCWKWYGAGIPDGLRRRSGNSATIQPKHNFTPFKYVPILIYDTIRYTHRTVCRKWIWRFYCQLTKWCRFQCAKRQPPSTFTMPQWRKSVSIRRAYNISHSSKSSSTISVGFSF